MEARFGAIVLNTVIGSKGQGPGHYFRMCA